MVSTAARRSPAGSSSAQIEPLEPRNLFADATFVTSIAVTLDGGWQYRITGNGTLLIQGTPENNSINVIKHKKSIEIDVTPGSDSADAKLYVPLWQVKRVVIEGGAGRDVIQTSGEFGKPVYVSGGKGNDTITGGSNQYLSGDAGNDHITAGDMPLARTMIFNDDGTVYDIIDIIDLQPILPSSVFGGAGDDTIVGSGGADTVSGGFGTDLLLLKGPQLPIDLANPIEGGQVDSIELVDRAPGSSNWSEPGYTVNPWIDRIFTVVPERGFTVVPERGFTDAQP